MDSSRMRTARLLPVSISQHALLWGGGYTCPGVPARGGVPAHWGYLPGGCVPAQGVYLPGGVPAQVLPPVDRQTRVKT